VTFALYAIALAAFVSAILVMQPSATARLATLPNGASIAVVSVAMACILHASRRREFTQRATIEHQRAALAELNAGLELRIPRAGLRDRRARRRGGAPERAAPAQVRERSRELSLALAKIARQRGASDTLLRGAVLAGASRSKSSSAKAEWAPSTPDAIARRASGSR